MRLRRLTPWPWAVVAIGSCRSRSNKRLPTRRSRLCYGEFGVVEPAAALDVVGVHPDYRGRYVAAALIDRLRTNLLGLGIHRLQTEAPWDNPDLVTFFQHEGFMLAPRFCLDLDLARTRT